jgi:hypothetical protein
MADQKASALTPFTPIATDILYGVDDPGVTPVSGVVTISALQTFMEANLGLNTSALTAGTLADARVAASNVTQHQAALSVATTQLTGTVATAQIADDAVTFPKLLNATQKSLIGAEAAGAFSEITLGANITLVSGVLDSTGGTDAAAIHDNVSGEISAITEKTAPVAADLIVIEDSAASNAKKRVQIGNLGGAGATSWATQTKSTFESGDLFAGFDPDNADPALKEFAVDRTDFFTQLSGLYAPLASPNAQTGTTYTLVLGDANNEVTMSNASANVLTIPPNSSVAFPVGTATFVSQLGAGATSIEGDTGVTVNGVSAGTGTILTQYGGVSLLKIATDTWLMQGAHGGVA